jgi:hypothetical protein
MDKADNQIITCTKPDMWPTVDELPEVDVSDLVRTFEATVEPES